ncbi:MAG TPA: hypothetical protein ENG12_00260, partial [Candidatus Altiarchaeales archaeon]|nr:hypothetical protein [Candidatus Altiarchaeales archaeon]
MKPVISRILWIICFALLFAGFLSGFVSAAYVLDVKLDPDIDAGDSFDVKLTINNTGNENLTNARIEIAIYVDGDIVHEDVESGITILENSSKIITISSTDFTTDDGYVWEKALMGYDCDKRTVRVKLAGDISAEDTATLDIDGEKLYVGMEPSRPTPSNEIAVEVEDEDGYYLDNMYVRITHLGDNEKWDPKDVYRERKTEDGKVTFDPLDEDFRFRDNPYGVYQLDVWHDGYCLFRDTFEVSNKLKITEVPENPYAGEEIRVKVLDIDDK